MDFLDTLARLLGRPPAHEVVRHDLGWTPSLRTSKKPPPADPTEAIAAFWQWWRSVEPQLEKLDTQPPSDAVLSGLDEHLRGLHRELAWELGPGVQKKHALTVSPDGVSSLRSLTAAWKAAAPGDLDDWEFHDTRCAVPGPAVALELELAGRTVFGHDVEVAVFDDEDRHRLDVWVYHPELARSGRRSRWQLAFLLVDAALGEEQVSTWLRTITPSVRPLREVAEIREQVVVLDLDGLRSRVAVRVSRGDPPPPPLADHTHALQIDPRARRWRFPRFDHRVRVQVDAHHHDKLEAWVEGLGPIAVPAVRRRLAGRVELDLYTDDAAALVARCALELPEASCAGKWDPGWALAGR